MEENQEPAELSCALAALASFQAVTQQADAKANMLLAVHVGVGVVLAAQAQTTGSPGRVPGCWIVVVAYLLAFCAGGYVLIQVMRPRTVNYLSGNMFAIRPWTSSPSVSRPEDTDEAPPCRRSEEAWEAARALARVADRKNHYVSAAIGWTSLTVVLAIVWLILLAFPR